MTSINQSMILVSMILVSMILVSMRLVSMTQIIIPSMIPSMTLANMIPSMIQVSMIQVSMSQSMRLVSTIQSMSLNTIRRMSIRVTGRRKGVTNLTTTSIAPGTKQMLIWARAITPKGMHPIDTNVKSQSDATLRTYTLNKDNHSSPASPISTTTRLGTRTTGIIPGTMGIDLNTMWEIPGGGRGRTLITFPRPNLTATTFQKGIGTPASIRDRRDTKGQGSMRNLPGALPRNTTESTKGEGDIRMIGMIKATKTSTRGGANPQLTDRIEPKGTRTTTRFMREETRIMDTKGTGRGTSPTHRRGSTKGKTRKASLITKWGLCWRIDPILNIQIIFIPRFYVLWGSNRNTIRI